MIIDNFLYFSGGAQEDDGDQAVTADGKSTNIADLGSSGQDIGTGENLYAVCVMTTALAGGTTDTMAVSIRAAADTALTSSTSNFAIGTFTVGDAAGKTLIARVPPGFAEGKQYVGAWYDETGTVTAGKFQCFLTKDVRKYAQKANAANAAVAIT